MTNLKPVTEGFNKFCGPAVLSILTGKSTDECANVISRINGQYKIRGVIVPDLLKAAERLGFDNKRVPAQGSLYRTLISLVSKDGMYIVASPTHYVCIEIKDKKIYFCDNHTKEPIPAASSARLGMTVESIHQVFEREKPFEPPKPVKIGEEILTLVFNTPDNRINIGIHRAIKFDQATYNKVEVIASFVVKDNNEIRQIVDTLSGRLDDV